jgi:hypothetical protein
VYHCFYFSLDFDRGGDLRGMRRERQGRTVHCAGSLGGLEEKIGRRRGLRGPLSKAVNRDQRQSSQVRSMQSYSHQGLSREE